MVLLENYSALNFTGKANWMIDCPSLYSDSIGVPSLRRRACFDKASASRLSSLEIWWKDIHSNMAISSSTRDNRDHIPIISILVFLFGQSMTTLDSLSTCNFLHPFWRALLNRIHNAYNSVRVFEPLPAAYFKKKYDLLLTCNTTPAPHIVGWPWLAPLKCPHRISKFISGITKSVCFLSFRQLSYSFICLIIRWAMTGGGTCLSWNIFILWDYHVQYTNWHGNAFKFLTTLSIIHSCKQPSIDCLFQLAFTLNSKSTSFQTSLV